MPNTFPLLVEGSQNQVLAPDQIRARGDGYVEIASILPGPQGPVGNQGPQGERGPAGSTSPRIVIHQVPARGAVGVQKQPGTRNGQDGIAPSRGVAVGHPKGPRDNLAAVAFRHNPQTDGKLIGLKRVGDPPPSGWNSYTKR